MRTPRNRPGLDTLATPIAKSEFERDGRRNVTALTLFLKGRECPLACTMCDLWQHTIPHPTPQTHLPIQIELGLQQYEQTEWLKLYNASNFFDPLAVPPKDYAAIAKLSENHSRIVVENHPRFDNRWIDEFSKCIAGQLEIAVGLESTDDSVLKLLNKGMNVAQARAAIEKWQSMEIDIRVFVLIKPPMFRQDGNAAIASTITTVEDAINWGVRHISLIPVRTDWGPLLEWTKTGFYKPPTAWQIERVAQAVDGLQNDRHSISVDLWDWSQVQGTCLSCCEPRRQRLEHWNQTGQWLNLAGCGVTNNCTGVNCYE